MNRGGFESSTESVCGGMHSKVAQVICEEVICDEQPVVYYRCETEAPAESNTRCEVPVRKKSEDKKWRRSNVLKRLEEGESASDQMRHKAQEGREEHERMRQCGGRWKSKGTRPILGTGIGSGNS